MLSKTVSSTMHAVCHAPCYATECLKRHSSTPSCAGELESPWIAVCLSVFGKPKSPNKVTRKVVGPPPSAYRATRHTIRRLRVPFETPRDR